MFKRSPNVEYIDFSFLDEGVLDSLFPISTTFFRNSITVVDTTHNTLRSTLVDSVRNEFEIYQKLGYLKDVGVTGLPDNKGKGSSRFSIHNNNLAVELDRIVNRTFAQEKEYQSVSDYFRFMKYTKGGQHYPHYDTDFIYGDGYKTTHSLVMFFTNNESGNLYFCNEPIGSTNKTQDWNRHASHEEIYLSIKPKVGRIVIFPHTLAHGVSECEEDLRIAVRGDLIYYEGLKKPL